MTFKTVLYVSKAQRYKAHAQLKTLVPRARAVNQKLDITGLLMFDGHHYAQLLEGPPKAIDAVMARIALDPRHSRLQVLSDDRRKDRSYVGFPLTYLYEERLRGLVTKLVDGKRVLSGIQIRDIFLQTAAQPPGNPDD